jgi:hypothetical protein
MKYNMKLNWIIIQKKFKNQKHINANIQKKYSIVTVYANNVTYYRNKWNNDKTNLNIFF